jgi:hypothetical protein
VLDPVAGALESLLAGGTSPSVATRVRGALDRLRQAGARR